MFIGDNEIISGLDQMPVVVMEGQSTELQLGELEALKQTCPTR